MCTGSGVHGEDYCGADRHGSPASEQGSGEGETRASVDKRQNGEQPQQAVAADRNLQHDTRKPAWDSSSTPDNTVSCASDSSSTGAADCAVGRASESSSAAAPDNTTEHTSQLSSTAALDNTTDRVSESLSTAAAKNSTSCESESSGTPVSDNSTGPANASSSTADVPVSLTGDVPVTTAPDCQNAAAVAEANVSDMPVSMDSGMVPQDVSQHGEVIFIVKDSDCQETALELVIDNAKGDDEAEEEEDEDDEDGEEEDLRNDDEIILYADPGGDEAGQRDVIEHEEVIGLDEDSLDREEEEEGGEDDGEESDGEEGAAEEELAVEAGHQCNQCSKWFSSRGRMLRHRRQHVDTGTFSCASCDCQFSTQVRSLGYRECGVLLFGEAVILFLKVCHCGLQRVFSKPHLGNYPRKANHGAKVWDLAIDVLHSHPTRS